MATSRHLKIGFILDTSLDPNDGVQQYVLAVGSWLTSQGHEVHYLVGETKHRKLENIHSLTKNIAVTFNGNRTTIPLLPNPFSLRSFIKRENFDVLHVQTPHHPFLAQPLILFAGKRTAVVGTFHILPYDRLSILGTRMLALILKPSLRRLDALLSVSQAAATFVTATYGMQSRVLPNVIDYPRFEKARPFTKYDDDILTILFLGRLVPRKGCLTLLRAVRELAADKSLPPFRVVICGKGPLREKLEDFVQQSQLQDHVIFEGFIEEAEKPRYYASADISVFPSAGGESFGIVLLEAMASGRSAILAGDNPGYHSVLSERPELLFDPQSVDDLAKKLRKLMTNKDLRKANANWGKLYAANFDVPVIGKHILAIYTDALRNRH
jgi:phosphatidyl-myo-inositol alpha-mannosyltransferase